MKGPETFKWIWRCNWSLAGEIFALKNADMQNEWNRNHGNGWDFLGLKSNENLQWPINYHDESPHLSDKRLRKGSLGCRRKTQRRILQIGWWHSWSILGGHITQVVLPRLITATHKSTSLSLLFFLEAKWQTCTRWLVGLGYSWWPQSQVNQLLHEWYTYKVCLSLTKWINSSLCMLMDLQTCIFISVLRKFSTQFLLTILNI